MPLFPACRLAIYITKEFQCIFQNWFIQTFLDRRIPTSQSSSIGRKRASDVRRFAPTATGGNHCYFPKDANHSRRLLRLRANVENRSLRSVAVAIPFIKLMNIVQHYSLWSRLSRGKGTRPVSSRGKFSIHPSMQEILHLHQWWR